jgi:hypothetical protein
MRTSLPTARVFRFIADQMTFFVAIFVMSVQASCATEAESALTAVPFVVNHRLREVIGESCALKSIQQERESDACDMCTFLRCNSYRKCSDVTREKIRCLSMMHRCFDHVEEGPSIVHVSTIVCIMPHCMCQ